MAGTVDLTLVIEGCSPDVDFGTIPLEATETTTVDTASGTDIYQVDCGGGGGRERVIAFELTGAADLELQWEQTGDHVFGLFEERGGACDTTLVSCFDPFGDADGITVFPRLQPAPYLLIVDAFDPGDEGSVTVWLTPQ
jgi:hypothetical protein